MENQKLATSNGIGIDDIELGQTVANLDSTKWRDLPFAIVYYISLAFTTILGIYLCTQLQDANVSETDGSLSFKFNFLQIFLGISTSLFFTVMWLLIIVNFSGCIIKSSLIISPVILFVFAVVSFVSSPFTGIILFLMGLFSVWYAWAVWNRIEFAVACLKIVVSVFKSYYYPLLINLFMSVVSIVLLVIDTTVLVAATYIINSSGLQFFVMFMVFLLIYWHNIVSINVAHVTACGVMGTWFYSNQMDGVTKNCFKRAVTTSFGSICFGSLIEAAIRALSALVRYLESRNSGNMGVAMCLCFLRCILDCLGDIIEYINSYAFVYVALYGTPYIQSAKDLWEMFKRRGIQALINDDLTTIPLWLGAIINIILIGLVCILFAGFDLNVIIAAIFGMVIYLCCVYTLISYIKTLFVCWMNDPDTFRANRPDQFDEIVSAANKFGYNTTWCH